MLFYNLLKVYKMSNFKLLFITAPADGKKQNDISAELMRAGFYAKDFIITAPRQTNTFKDLWLTPKSVKGKASSKVKYVNEEKITEFKLWLATYLVEKQITHICINDVGVYNALYSTKYQTLNALRGFSNKFAERVVFTVDDYTKTYSKWHSDNVYVSAWTWKKDLAKLRRICADKIQPQPAFAYSVPDNLTDLRELCDNAIMSGATISCDIETAHNVVSCIGFGYLTKEGKYTSFVVPFIWYKGCYWGSEKSYAEAWLLVCKVFKEAKGLIFHNGIYDLTYCMKFGAIPGGVVHDTMYLWQAIWQFTPKSLAYCASLLVDISAFWKDEVKDERDSSQAQWAIPTSQLGMQNYWFYNAVDVYMTCLVANSLSEMVLSDKADWALENYTKKMLVQWGAALMMNNFGLKIDETQRSGVIKELENEAANARVVLDRMISPDFNPNSPAQMKKFFYEFLGDARPDKKGAISTDKTVMERIGELSPIHAQYYAMVRDYKTAAANVSKYGYNLSLVNDRFLFQLNNSATWTGRFGGRSNAFDHGTNPQNIPKEMRKLFVSDPGFVLLEADFSNSDTFFVAFESGDPKMIKMLTEGFDGHSLHAEMLFGIPYEEVKAGKSSGKMKFIRDLTKKTTHGAAYLLGETTMFNQIGRPTLVEAAEIMGIKNAAQMTNVQLIKFCRFLMDKYQAGYPQVGVWKQALQKKVAMNDFKTTAYGGLTTKFMANPATDHATYRALIAFHGQGGTAGNINRSMLDFYYGNDYYLPKQGVQLRMQVHDSLLFAIPEDKLHLADYCIKHMQSEIHLQGRTFHVPVEAAFLYRWGGKEIAFTGFTPEKSVEWYMQQLKPLKEY